MAEKRIVYLENDEAEITSLGDVLKELNYDVELSKNPAMAEKAAGSNAPDLVIVSMDITNADPTDFIKKIKSDKSLSKLKYMFISSTFDEETFFDEFGEIKSKNCAFIKRPYKIEDAVDVVENAIGLPSPPKGVFPVSLGAQRELLHIKKENEELKAELSHKSQEGISSKATLAEKAAYIKELQTEIDKQKEEKASIEEELKLVKEDLYKKNKSAGDIERKLEELKIKKENDEKKLKEELEELKKEYKEDKEKHKKAQKALREFYKPKLANVSKLEKELEKSKSSMEKVEKLEAKLKEKDEEIDKLKAFKEKMKKMMDD